jgi:hypothetical protein
MLALKLVEVTIPYLTQVMYLGVIFDNNLYQCLHISHKILKAKHFLMLLAGIQNKNIGPLAMFFVSFFLFLFSFFMAMYILVSGMEPLCGVKSVRKRWWQKPSQSIIGWLLFENSCRGQPQVDHYNP